MAAAWGHQQSLSVNPDEICKRASQVGLLIDAWGHQQTPSAEYDKDCKISPQVGIEMAEQRDVQSSPVEGDKCSKASLYAERVRLEGTKDCTREDILKKLNAACKMQRSNVSRNVFSQLPERWQRDRMVAFEAIDLDPLGRVLQIIPEHDNLWNPLK
jgi:hypothetical protein